MRLYRLCCDLLVWMKLFSSSLPGVFACVHVYQLACLQMYSAILTGLLVQDEPQAFAAVAAAPSCGVDTIASAIAQCYNFHTFTRTLTPHMQSSL